ncbi:serine/threonine transporter SstT [Enterococcus mundtii]|uniref:Serine/threonine transporter SstT n=1 Tax=Enterococcus mundtii TaxID=53346 RepID=A0AAI8RA74_ENTMU|nr:serine/threonine transporter SstT [Enterococcus mundtii]QCJ55360.1 serine/threonine transporter SstT [Enterococcus mundtii]BAO05835.1 DAACS family dicarboxylate/amino acid/sodium (Na+) symporter [Enterococcus mundtii QU 25]BBM15106.1 sodium/dicarboxylate symporter [Enterococcus mundtii]
MLEKFLDMSLVQRIGCGILIGIILGIFLPTWGFIALLGTLFVSCLKAIAPLLVFFLTAASIAKHKMGNETFVKPILGLYLGGTFFAAFVAVITSSIFTVPITLQETASEQAPQNIGTVLSTMLTNVTQNPIQAIIDSNYLGVLFWAILLGLALRARTEATKEVIDQISVALSQVVQLIISFAPIGILGLVYESIATTGLSGLTEYLQLVLVLVGTMLFVALIIYPLLTFLFIKENPYPLIFFCLKESAISAFFTRSSAANIPINMMLAEKLKLTKESYAISIPLGATINMGGAAVTITVMTLTTVQALGIEASFALKLILSILAALAACGASGVAGGSLLLIPLACSLFGISNDIAMQVVGIGFIIGVIQDSVETALNSSSDLLFTAIGELGARKRNGEDVSIKSRLSELQ